MIRKACFLSTILLTLAAIITYGTSWLWPQYYAGYRRPEVWMESALEEGYVFVLILENKRYPLFPVFIRSYAHARQLVRKRVGRTFSTKAIPGFPPPGIEAREYAVDLWIPVLAFATYPSLTFIRGPARRWRRRRNGWCLHCGYNLQGNVSGVCPECGTSAEKNE